MKQRVDVIEPDGRRTTDIKCLVCDMAYSHRDYKILRDVKKLTYFNLVKMNGPKVICHMCLPDAVLAANDNKTTEVVLVSKKQERDHTFYGSNSNPK